MEDLDQKIIELMDLFDDEQVTTADKIDRPEKALEKQAIDDFMKRNPMAGGGMLVQPGFGGVRQGYAQPKLYEKYSQYFFNKPYSEIKPDTKEYYKIHNAIRSAGGKFKAPKSKKGVRFRKELENKILKAYPNADFEKYGRYGFPKTTGTREQFLNYTRVRDFIARGFKTGVRDKLPVAVQRAIMIKFENDVPKNFKWGFNKPNQKYGIPETSKGGKYFALGKRIINFVNNPTPDHRLWNYQTPEGWMMSVMNRNFMQYGDEYYEPLFDKVNGKNTIVGFKDKTNFGKGKDYYYGIKRAKDRNGVHVRNHPDFDNTKKYFNIASKIKDPPNKTIQKILKQGNVTIDGRLTLNNLLNYLINEKGRIQTNRALVLHHKGGLKLRATGDYQLLNRLTNAKITGVEDAMRSGDITKENIDFLKKNNASVIVDGVTYGGGPKTAEEGFKQTEKFVEQRLGEEIKTDPQLKNLKTVLASMGDGNCPVTFGKKKKDGGRIGYQTGTSGLNQCIESGIKNFNEGKFKTADQAQDAARLLGGGKNVLRAITKYGIAPEAAFVAGESIFRTVLGEEPLNAIKKSIDSLTFGATDFTSGIDAAKFGKDADRKLAVDKFRENQNKVNSIEQQIANLETLNTGSQFGYEGDQTEAIQMKKAQLEAAKKELEKNYVNSDIVQYIDRKAENIADAERAKSIDSKLRLKSQMEGMPGVADYMDTETARVFPKQPSQTKLNLNMLPSFQDGLKTDQAKVDRTIMNAPDEVLQSIAPDALEIKKALKEAYKMENLKDTFGAEQIYGTQGVFSQPLAGGGIAKMAGDRSGAMLTSMNPDSQGLSGLLKRGIKT